MKLLFSWSKHVINVSIDDFELIMIRPPRMYGAVLFYKDFSKLTIVLVFTEIPGFRRILNI